MLLNVLEVTVNVFVGSGKYVLKGFEKRVYKCW